MNDEITNEELEKIVEKVNDAIGVTTFHKAQKVLSVVLSTVYVHVIVESLKEGIINGIIDDEQKKKKAIDVFMSITNDRANYFIEQVKESVKKNIHKNI